MHAAKSHPVAATEAHMRLAAERAADDPVRLRRAVRIVQAALARGRLTVDELAPPSTTDGGH